MTLSFSGWHLPATVSLPTQLQAGATLNLWQVQSGVAAASPGLAVLCHTAPTHPCLSLSGTATGFPWDQIRKTSFTLGSGPVATEEMIYSFSGRNGSSCLHARRCLLPVLELSAPVLALTDESGPTRVFAIPGTCFPLVDDPLVNATLHLTPLLPETRGAELRTGPQVGSAGGYLQTQHHPLRGKPISLSAAPEAWPLADNQPLVSTFSVSVCVLWNNNSYLHSILQFTEWCHIFKIFKWIYKM